MGSSLKANSTVDNAFVERDLGADYTQIWVSFQMYFGPGALALWQSGGESFAQLWNAAHDETLEQLDIDSSGWDSVGYFGNVPPPTANVWQRIECEHVSGGAVAFYVDGSLVWSGTDPSSGAAVRFLTLGAVFGNPDAANISYYRHVKVGTTRGASDVFADDFSTGDLSAWTSKSGDVSVFPPAAPFVLIPAAVEALSLAEASVETLTLTPV